MSYHQRGMYDERASRGVGVSRRTLRSFVDQYALIWTARDVMHFRHAYLVPPLPLQPHHGMTVALGCRQNHLYNTHTF